MRNRISAALNLLRNVEQRELKAICFGGHGTINDALVCFPQKENTNERRPALRGLTTTPSGLVYTPEDGELRGHRNVSFKRIGRDSSAGKFIYIRTQICLGETLRSRLVPSRTRKKFRVKLFRMHRHTNPHRIAVRNILIYFGLVFNLSLY